MRMMLTSATAIWFAALSFCGTASAATVTLELNGYVESGGGVGPDHVANGDPVFARIVFFTESFGSSAPYPNPLRSGDPNQTFYWFPESIYWESGQVSVLINPIPRYFLPGDTDVYTVVRNDYQAGPSNYVDELLFKWSGNVLSLGSGFAGPTGGPLSSGSIEEAVARADEFENSTLSLMASNYSGMPGPLVVRIAPSQVPVPAAAWLLIAGLAAIAWMRRQAL